MSKCRFDLSKDCNNTDCLNCVLGKIRAEIAKDLSNAEKESRYTQDDIDCGICVGLKRTLDVIDKYRGESKDADSN